MSLRSHGALLAVVFFLGLAAGVGSPAVAAAESTGERVPVPVLGDADAVSTHTPAPNATREPATMTMRLQLQPDGDVRWQVSATYEFRDEADAAAFDDLAADFEDGEVSLVLDTLRLARQDASGVTGREMTLRNVERTTSRNDTVGEGTLTMAVTWTNFARVEGDRLSVGDAFNTTDGTWLPRLTERQTLVVEPPEGYGVVSAPQVGIVDGTVRWEGPHRFDGREPWVVYSGDTSPTVQTTTAPLPTTTAPPPPPTTTATTTAPPTTTTPPGGGGLDSVLPLAILVVVAGASAAMIAAYVRRDERLGSGDAGTEPDDAGSTVPDDDAADSTADTDEAGREETATAAAGATADDGVDEELLSDEERVERLLEENGGRMKQAAIVTETGWSNAKVSQLLSSMAEEGQIDKLRIGRENLISFPDEDVADITDDENA